MNYTNCKFSTNFRIRVLGFVCAVIGTSSLSVGLAFAQSQNVAKQQAPQYVSFLDLLPLALSNDDGIKAAKLITKQQLRASKRHDLVFIRRPI